MAHVPLHVLLLVAACGSSEQASEHARPSPAVQPRQPQSTPDAPATTSDPSRFARAKVVLRVVFVRDLGGSKYHWDEVRPLATLKNDSTRTFTAPLLVGHYGWHQGVPPGESTIYLEPYGETTTHWRLLDGDGAVGVSHRSP